MVGHLRALVLTCNDFVSFTLHKDVQGRIVTKIGKGSLAASRNRTEAASPMRWSYVWIATAIVAVMCCISSSAKRKNLEFGSFGLRGRFGKKSGHSTTTVDDTNGAVKAAPPSAFAALHVHVVVVDAVDVIDSSAMPTVFATSLADKVMAAHEKLGAAHLCESNHSRVGLSSQHFRCWAKLTTSHETITAEFNKSVTPSFSMSQLNEAVKIFRNAQVGDEGSLLQKLALGVFVRLSMQTILDVSSLRTVLSRVASSVLHSVAPVGEEHDLQVVVAPMFDGSKKSSAGNAKRFSSAVSPCIGHHSGSTLKRHSCCIHFLTPLCQNFEAEGPSDFIDRFLDELSAAEPCAFT